MRSKSERGGKRDESERGGKRDESEREEREIGESEW
jgi:hypothetical protein